MSDIKDTVNVLPKTDSQLHIPVLQHNGSIL